MTTAMKMVLASVAACLALGAMAETPVISDVTVRQRWPWSKLVDIDYVLSGAAQDMDIAVSAFNGANPLTLTETSLTGDLYGVSDGAHRIVWDPTVTAYTNVGVLGQFRVALTPTPAPLYMIVDLTKDAGADGQIEYVYESDLTNGLWGAWVRNPITNALGEAIVESVIWTGVATNDIYKTDKLVLRRVPAGGVSWQMGSPSTEPGHNTHETQRDVTLPSDFYIGVFEVTQEQYAKFAIANPYFNNTSYAPTRPIEQVGYCEIRGLTADASYPDAPATTSFLGKLRTLTGVDFDFPGEAQWEFACRAGAYGVVWNDGDAITNATADANLSELGRYGYNGGKVPVGDGTYTNAVRTVSTEYGTAAVGSYKPNSLGLYDMHGNVWEWCLDWYQPCSYTNADTAAVISTQQAGYEVRVMKGGGYSGPAKETRSASWTYFGPMVAPNIGGFRVAAPAKKVR